MKEHKKKVNLQAQSNPTDSRKVWSTPVLTSFKLEDAESGNNFSENQVTGS